LHYDTLQKTAALFSYHLFYTFGNLKRRLYR